MFCVGSCRLSRSGRSMYVKSARINWYSLSGVASSTLLLTGFPSTLVRSPARTTRKFLRLMAILNGTKVLVRTTSSALRFHVHSTKEGSNNLCEMGHFSKPKQEQINKRALLGNRFVSVHVKVDLFSSRIAAVPKRS